MLYEIFAYGNGQIMSDILNGVASIMSDDSGYETYIKMGVSLAFGSILIMTAFDLKLSRVFKWYALVMIVYSVLIIPKANVLITDPVLRNQQFQVSNVPVGLAFTLSVLTTVEYQLTTGLETAFHIPDDRSYNQTGMLMASDMVRKATSFKILNGDLANNLNSYIHQCIQYDLLHGKYTVQELFNSEDIWKFTSSYASRARAFIYNNEIVTCSVGVELLENAFKGEIEAATYVFGKRMFGNRKQEDIRQIFTSYLQSSYEYMANISSSASKIMQQAMMINAYHDAVINNAAQLGAAAAVESYAVARATQNSRSSYKVSGEVAARLLPYIKNTLQLLLIGTFIVIVPMFFLISGVARIRQYAEILASLTLWGPLYAILNMQMTSEGRWKILGMATQPTTNKTAITIANLPGIEQIAADQAILAGYLALSIPLIAYGLIRGSMYSFSSLASGIMGVAQSSSGHAAEEATTGNYSLGNLSMENANAFNTSAFHSDNNARISSGMVTVEGANGSLFTQNVDGSSRIDNRGGLSTLGTNLNLSERILGSAQSSYTQSTSAAQTQMVEASEALSSAYHDTYELSKVAENYQGSDRTSILGESASQVESLNQFRSYVDALKEQNGWSEDEAFSAMASGQISGKGLPLLSGLSAGVTATNNSSNQHQLGNSTDFTNSESVNSVIDSGVRAASDMSNKSGESEVNRLSGSVRTNMDTVDGLRSSISENLQEANAYQKAMNFAKENSASLNTDGTQFVTERLLKSENPDTGRPYTSMEITNLDKAGKLGDRIQPIVNQYTQGIAAQAKQIDEKKDEIKQTYMGDSAALNARAGELTDQHGNNKENIKSSGKLRDVDTSTTPKVRAKIKDNNGKIELKSDELVEKGQKVQSNLDDSSSKSLRKKTVGAVIDRAKETLSELGGKNDEKN